MSEHTAALDLGPELTIVQAAALREQLLAHLGQHTGALRLDLSGASDVDSATVQLLLALRRSLAERGEALQITGLSRAASDALAVYGLHTGFAPAA
jgi:anti-sigma B factor antagonist